ncbi:unnamed protein product [Protopolystoma xenopodis]|uniref:Uncharacterized protein n=1 Tax=Protopolystoma xenopodis TaxID=117903 RepID=A0A448X177_9PLAT|nr:unnamed protein product [Protopolystoma xenopodis]
MSIFPQSIRLGDKQTVESARDPLALATRAQRFEGPGRQSIRQLTFSRPLQDRRTGMQSALSTNPVTAPTDGAGELHLRGHRLTS